ncbi:hypothetical protein [Leisingera sp. M523]|uniref:hypothetical protein n=1 Tax=Leisingera sp. M523 TaxID=2867013 RepID=UPI0021A55D28|nr:hypothetical protein [Leisingera sp. M523]UWQ30215.1 hypothetical protein K3557_06675 [Leisingera sp. M523]
MSLDTMPAPTSDLQHEIEHLKANRDVLEKAHGDLARSNEQLLSSNRELEEEVQDLRDRLDRAKNAHFELLRDVQRTLPTVTRLLSESASDILDAYS